jgi:nucleotide-binding universal stress UspA family protein
MGMDMMFRKLLVPLDGSEQAAGVLPYVVRLASGLDVPIVLLTVIDSEASVVPERFRKSEGQNREGGEAFDPFTLAGIEVAARNMLERVTTQLSNHGVASEYRVVRGVPAIEIIRAANELGCDLIAMSTHGRNIFSRAILGSVTDKVVHTSTVPVLTTTMAMKEEISLDQVKLGEVVVPLDGSALAETALPYAESLARKMSLEINLVTVIDTGGPYQGLLDDARSAELEPEIRANALEYLRKLAGELRAKGLSVRADVTDGNPGVVLTQLLHRPRQRIVVMASHGLSGLSRWWLGSVTETLIRTSVDPVLVIPSSSQTDD